ncbi:M28 family peptidase [Streptomyces sp. NRRL F-5630]|uniref:M28 family peptidase n=1 Tax=Streptomyces sp. NRRL F-5630 TaxID=1463864 RepID=UPI003D74CE81
MASGLVASTTLGAQAHSAPLAGGISRQATQHLLKLNAIAARHGGNRAAGLPGFEYSARYVESQLHRVGFRTRRQKFNYTRIDHLRATVEQTRPQRRAIPNSPAEGLAASTSGGNTGELVAPRDAFGDSTESWTGTDARGKVALVQLRPNAVRGARTERVNGCHGGRPSSRHRIAADQTEAARQALIHAREAGAVAVLFFLDQVDFPIGLLFDAPGDIDLPPAAVIFSSDATALRRDMGTAGATVRVDLELRERAIETFNLLTVPWDTTHRNVFGAHLDSVPTGPGIDDNASGSGLLLSLALSAGIRKSHGIQFCWWGGEEDGMRGSQRYVETEDLKSINGYFNTDMVAAPNYVISVYGNGPQRHYIDHFSATGQTWIEGPLDGMSDQIPFLDKGIPVAGVDTVHSSPARLKSEKEEELFGGTAGQPFDPNYHASGDTISNISAKALSICTAASYAALRAVAH